MHLIYKSRYFSNEENSGVYVDSGDLRGQGFKRLTLQGFKRQTLQRLKRPTSQGFKRQTLQRFKRQIFHQQKFSWTLIDRSKIQVEGGMSCSLLSH